jgi:hypothetical protein
MDHDLASELTRHIGEIDSLGDRSLLLDIAWWRHFGWLEACGYRLTRTGSLMKVSW